MWMLTFDFVLGYQGLLFRDFLWFFFLVFFFQSDRSTQCQETHSTVNEKKRDGLRGNEVGEIRRVDKGFMVFYSSWANPVFSCSQLMLQGFKHIIGYTGTNGLFASHYPHCLFLSRSLSLLVLGSGQSVSQQAMRAVGKNRLLWNCKCMKNVFCLVPRFLLLEYLQNYAVLIDFHWLG